MTLQQIAFRSALALAIAAGTYTSAMAADTRADQIRRKLDDPAAGVFIAAHRGCHNPSPRLNLGPAPENSLPALEHCVRLGVDMMELDVRRTRDDVLVVIHDDSVDRTTNGQGKVADLTLAQLQRLRLKQNFGADMSPELTAETIPTLATMLQAAKGRIMLNLDLKADDYPAAIAEARAHGMLPYVLVKSVVTNTAAVAADRPEFADVAYMPMVGHWNRAPLAGSLAEIARYQLAARRRPVGVEMVFVPRADYPALRAVVADAKVRLWANTLTEVGVISVIGMGGDLDALRTSGQAWGDMFKAGIDTIQTDEPGPLLDYLEREGIKH